MERKQMAFAGSWYPDTGQACESSIQQFLKQGRLQGDFVGGIVPHAGWYYSGSIACRVIASLQPLDTAARQIDTILLFGGHMHPQSEPFIMTQGEIETPLGVIQVDGDLVEKISAGLGIRKRSPLKFPDENTLELQYPFIKYFFPRARIIVCGVAPSLFAGIIARTAVDEAQKMDRHLRVIGSTDMTHYGPDFGFTPAGTGKKAVEWVTQENDHQAIQAMKEMDETQIIAQGQDHRNMCCAGAVAATAAACKALGAVKALELDYATSFERSRSDSFVGYAGLVYARS